MPCNRDYCGTVSNLEGDSKAALIVFVNGTNFTTVLSSIEESVVSHPYYIRSNGEHGKTSYSYIFQLPHDAQKEVYLEVVAKTFVKNLLRMTIFQ